MSATTVAPVDGREVVTCDHCNLVQFRTTTSACRRCYKPVSSPKEAEKTPALPTMVAPKTPPPPVGKTRFVGCLGKLLRSIRTHHKLSQGELAKRFYTSRSYVTRIEAGNLVPSFFSLERYACALGTKASSLAALTENPKTKLEPAFDINLINRNILCNVGPVFRKLREEANLRQPDIATLTNGNPERCSEVSNIERGAIIPKLRYFEQFASAINIPLSVVFAEIERAAFTNSE